MFRILCAAAFFIMAAPVAAETHLAPLAVSANGHYFVTPDGDPFFWLGDTAWELIHATTADEADYYLTTRARQGYTVIQTVVLGEIEGVTRPTPDGRTPFIGNDPSKPDPAYFERVAAIVDRADQLGLYVALLPAWGDKMTAPWGAGPRLFTPDNLPAARAYGRYLGQCLKGHRNIIWMLGGDRPSHVDTQSPVWLQSAVKDAGFPVPVDWRPVWAAMADGIKEGWGADPLVAYHPPGGVATSQELSDAAWLDIDGTQSGHGVGHDVPVWETITRDFTSPHPKPTLDLEPNYEDHPYNPWPRWDAGTGYFDAYDVRKQTYRSVFAGAAGVTYGHHSVWGFVGGRNDVMNHAKMDWIIALQRPGGREMVFLRNLIESRPQLDRIPDDGLILKGQDYGGLHMVATRDNAGTYAFVYFPLNDRKATIDLSRLKAGPVKAWWYDPRTGAAHPLATYDGQASLDVESPPFGPDWVLVLDSVAAKYAPPGIPIRNN